METTNTIRKARKQVKPGQNIYKADVIDGNGRPTGKHFYIVGSFREASDFVGGRPLKEVN